jgi:hypothetical protein
MMSHKIPRARQLAKSIRAPHTTVNNSVCSEGTRVVVLKGRGLNARSTSPDAVAFITRSTPPLPFLTRSTPKKQPSFRPKLLTALS